MLTNENTMLATMLPSSGRSTAGEQGRSKATLLWASAVALLCACSQRTASADPTVSSEPNSKVFAARAAGSTLDPALEDKLDEAELRRGYGIVDMRFNSCVTRETDYAVSGSDCPQGFLIYGPYVSVPANSDIDISFEVRPSKDVLIYADIVSQMGTQTLAGLNRQRVDAGQLQKLGYRVHVFNADANVESRIGMDAEPGTKFEILNLTMTVR